MFPEPYTVGHAVRVVSHDGMSVTETWSTPAKEVRVYGWGPPAPDDVIRAEQTGVEHVLDVYMRSSTAKHRDKFIVNGTEFLVQGEPDDYRFGPFGFRPGVRVRLSRVVG